MLKINTYNISSLRRNLSQLTSNLDLTHIGISGGRLWHDQPISDSKIWRNIMVTNVIILGRIQRESYNINDSTKIEITNQIKGYDKS